MLNYQKYRASSCRGMSLVEMIVVMAILSVVMMAVMSLYVPALQSTAAQTQVSDVQANLRLAMTRMTQDLLTARFLTSGQPVVFDPSAPANDQDFTIRTRIVGNGFGRITSAVVSTVTPPDIELTLSKADMVEYFPDNSQVRLFNPVATRECGSTYDESIVATAKTYVYTVTDTDKANSKVTIDTGGNIAVGDVFTESVLVRIANDDQPPLQTIRYRFFNGALERIVNGNTQFLARNLSSVNFGYVTTSAGRVQKIDIALTGQTKALKNDAISGAKSRQLQTSVVLRNVF
jgi:prepilin-type N-terminal cleavage/methylation domain-containing protein